MVLYDEGMAVLGECGMVDLVAILGYYGMVALTLNAFASAFPEAMPRNSMPMGVRTWASASPERSRHDDRQGV